MEDMDMDKDKREGERGRPPATAGRAPLDLSVCFIARDEERDLPRALASVRRVAREIIVVDTGSRDQTPRIAEEHGARVLHHPFADHFAQARNVALAAATAPWILMLDADEALDPGSAPALARALRDPALAQIVLVHHIAPGLAESPATTLPPRQPGPAGQRPRGAAGPPLHSLLLFRRHPEIRYHGRVHESIVASLLRLGATRWPYSGVQIAHYGYQEAAERARKAQRNLRLLELAVQEEPQDLYLRLKLAQTLPPGERRRALLLEAAAQAQALSAEALAGYPFLPRLFAAAGTELLANGALGSARGLAEGLGARLGAAGAFTCGRLLILAGALAAGEAALSRYLEGAWQEETALVLPDPEASPAAALHLLGFAALLRGQAEPASALLRRAQAAGPEGPERFGHPAALEADRVRCALLLSRYREVTDGLARLEAGMSASAPLWRREALLVSGEIALVQGDPAGALPLLARALEGVGADDHAAALCALTHLRAGADEEARALLPRIPGARCDTQALRLLLAQRLDPTALPPDEEVAPLARHLAALYARHLPAPRAGGGDAAG